MKICNDKNLSGIFRNAIDVKNAEDELKEFKRNTEKERNNLIEEIEKFKKDARDARNHTISYKFKLDLLEDEVIKKE